MGEVLVGAHEIAQMFGVTRQAVHNWLKEPARWAFPEPMDTIKAGKVWRTADVLEWAADQGRTPRTLASVWDEPGDNT